ncbi:N-formyl peptide receptor 3-like [Leptodactylus fuscus]|uniref:N-formyl peptide receptor 3-like n=1 Tax=Leptodactylus fuscus TaxID=238119 RepID=UPI003F4EC9AB
MGKLGRIKRASGLKSRDRSAETRTLSKEAIVPDVMPGDPCNQRSVVYTREMFLQVLISAGLHASEPAIPMILGENRKGEAAEQTITVNTLKECFSGNVVTRSHKNQIQSRPHMFTSIQTTPHTGTDNTSEWIPLCMTQPHRIQLRITTTSKFRFFLLIVVRIRTTDNESCYNSSSCREVVYICQKVSFTFYSIIFVLGIIGNGLVIWIAGFRMKKTITAVWFLNLAIADFLFCSSLILQIAQWAEIFVTVDISAVCVLAAIMFTINMSASVLLLTAMSIDRCVSVMWPFWARAHRTRRLVRITAGGIWGLSFILTAVMVYLDVRNYTNELDQWLRLVIMFVIPFLIILTSYVIIFIKLRRSKRPRRSQRPYRIITAVILCFFICWSPYYILPLTSQFYERDIDFYSELTTITILAYLNSCLNPIIYVLMSENIRANCFRSIPARVQTALTEHPDDLSREPENGDNTLSRDV